ncbi:hypothetical protein [Frondihabitans cladoniiphilus]|uniref:Uncharacterized protein n=1 Tax=Frondihabitans cladoniiphilus TaxID=715785 RepID=A0ABP8VZD5_9MICO
MTGRRILLAAGIARRWRHPAPTHPAVSDPEFQDALLDRCARFTGVTLPTLTPKGTS